MNEATAIATETCPVIELANDILGCQEDILKKVRRFKNRARRMCKRCKKQGKCEALSNINTQIETAISEVMAEWGL